MVDVTPKFERDPANSPDLSLDDFMARKKVLEQVQDWKEKNGGGRGKPDADWVPIAYMYEVSAIVHIGPLVFQWTNSLILVPGNQRL